MRMGTGRRFSLSLATLLLLAEAGAGIARADLTLWNWLGIPQGVNKIRDATVNRNGNRPWAERKPPLKGIADPANLESNNPAIKKAAEIKQQEDLAKQKIKAIKYLARIGCGCYPGVKEALMAALDDCTEVVRYTAARQIGIAASQQCRVCNRSCCCDEDMMKKLAEIAYERDDCGCFIEPSERVRAAARQSLMVCCRSKGDRGGVPVGEVPSGETVPPPPAGETVPPAPADETVPPAPPSDAATLFEVPPGADQDTRLAQPEIEFGGTVVVFEHGQPARHVATRVARPTGPQPNAMMAPLVARSAEPRPDAVPAATAEQSAAAPGDTVVAPPRNNPPRITMLPAVAPVESDRNAIRARPATFPTVVPVEGMPGGMPREEPAWSEIDDAAGNTGPADARSNAGSSRARNASGNLFRAWNGAFSR
jgi:hypothetical protein